MGFLNKTSKVFGYLSHSYPFLLFANIFIIGSLLSWLLLTNLYINSYQEKFMQEKWANLVNTFPKEPNASAIELESFLARFGAGSNSLSEISPEVEAIRKNNSDGWQAIIEDIRNYSDTQETKTEDNIDQIPDELKSYLTQHSDQIDLVVNHLNVNELPVWGITYLSENKLPDFTMALPSFLNLVNFQRLLVLSAIDKSQAGRHVDAMETLSASLKLTATIAQRPDLISQLVAIIGINIHAKNIIKLDRISSDWANNIAIPNLQKLMVNSLKIETFSVTETFRKNSILHIKFAFFGEDEESFTAPFEVLQRLFQQPFLHLAANNYFQRMMQHIEQISSFSAEQFCSLKTNFNLDNSRLDPIPWNPLLRDYQSYTNQLFKANKALLRWELTKKIIQIKEQVIQTGAFPSQITGIETSHICPDLSWDYRVTSDGEMSISLSQSPEWLEISENELPLSYSLRIEDIE
jgi:hypothetical protein